MPPTGVRSLSASSGSLSQHEPETRITGSNLLTALAKVSQLLAQATAAHQMSHPLDISEFP